MQALKHVVTAFLFVAATAGAAHAQATRTWVSGVGDDANPCSRTAPCKTFAGSISKTAAAGEISVLDPGGYGAVTITKGMTLNGDGTLAGILAAGTNGIIINAQPTDTVVIRNISIHGAGTGLNGIRILNAGAVHVENVTIHGFTLNGILVEGANPVKVHLRNVRMSAVPVGLNVNDTTPDPMRVIQVVMDDVQFIALDKAVHVMQGTLVARDSIFSGGLGGMMPGAGVHSEGTARVTLEGGVVLGSDTAIQADAPVVLSDVLITGNTTGLAGMVTSFGNNRLGAGNTTPGMPTTTLPLQ